MKRINHFMHKIKIERINTLRSMLEREVRKGAKSGSLRMFFHFPGPCFATPASSASSSSDVHFCFWFPILNDSLSLSLSLSEKQQKLWKKERKNGSSFFAFRGFSPSPSPAPSSFSFFFSPFLSWNYRILQSRIELTSWAIALHLGSGSPRIKRENIRLSYYCRIKLNG